MGRYMSRYKAIRQPRHTGKAAWNDILGPRQTQPKLTQHRSADVVIIGAGFAGLAAARRLQQLQPNASVVILEAGELAEGATGRNSGFMIDLPHDLASDNYAGAGADNDRRMTTLNRSAIAFSQAAVNEYGIDPAYFEPVGKINGAAGHAGEQHNRDYMAHLDALNEPCEWLDANAMQSLTGSQHYRSGLYTPGTVMLQPAGYIRQLAAGLMHAAKHNTVRLYEHSGVTGFERSGSGWRVRTAQGTVSTDRIILANNGHLESFGVERSALMHLFLYASMTRELTDAEMSNLGGTPRWGITPADPMGTTMRRIDTAQGGNRIVTRTCATLCPDMVAPQREMDRAAQVHRVKFDQRFPALAGIDMDYQWAGHLCLSRNGVSVMREIDDGVFSACVQNGLGTARGTLTGMGAAELAVGETSAITQYFSEAPRPTKLPPKPLAAIGANLYLRWKEWRAGAE